MKVALFLKKITAIAAAACFVLSICGLSAFAQSASSSDKGQVIDSVYCEPMSVKDSFVPEQNIAVKQKTEETAVVNTGNKTAPTGIFGKITQAVKAAVSKVTKAVSNIFSKLGNAIKDLFSSTAEKKKKEQEAKYNAVVDELVKQSGLSREVVEKAFSQFDKDQLNKAIDVLSEMFKSRKDAQTQNPDLDPTQNPKGNIITCGLFALSAALNIPPGEAAFLALIADIKIGGFSEKSLDAGSNYGVTFQAQLEVLRAFGYEKPGIYTMPFDKFLSSMQPGESAILTLNLAIEGEKTSDGNNHSIAVKKEVNSETGKIQYVIFDDGVKSVYGEDEIAAVLSGQKTVSWGSGKQSATYNAVDKNGKINFVSVSNRIWVAPQTTATFAKENANVQNMLKSVIYLIKK
ncbi:MAG: hypothetical protein FWC57_00680 [Endomicrobia bacterium]|nr:hypothetical protein [Endomicrobiia bacterium]